MDERTKLTGIARYSPRLNLLKRFAGSENPILSISAMYLLRDRTARRIGGYFEFIFLVLLPVIAVVMIMMSFSDEFGSRSPYSRNLFSEAFPMLLGGIGYLARPIAYIYGFMLLNLPGVTITKREADGAVLRMLPMDRTEVFKGMLKLNFASFFMAPAIFYIFEFGFVVLAWVVLRSISPEFDYWDLNYSMGFLPLDARALITAWVLVFLFYASVYAIHPSFRYRVAWSSFMALMGGLFIFIAVLLFGTTLLMGAYETYYNYDPPIDTTAYVIGVVILLLAMLFASAIFFARGAIAYRINPVK